MTRTSDGEEGKAQAWTPGPWHFERSGCWIWAQHLRGLGRVAQLSVSFRGEEQIEANGRLIAAAPDLYDAANVALGHLTGGMDGDWRDCDPIKLLRAALARIEGR